MGNLGPEPVKPCEFKFYKPETCAILPRLTPTAMRTLLFDSSSYAHGRRRHDPRGARRGYRGEEDVGAAAALAVHRLIRHRAAARRDDVLSLFGYTMASAHGASPGADRGRGTRSRRRPRARRPRARRPARSPSAAARRGAGRVVDWRPEWGRRRRRRERRARVRGLDAAGRRRRRRRRTRRRPDALRARRRRPRGPSSAARRVRAAACEVTLELARVGGDGATRIALAYWPASAAAAAPTPRPTGAAARAGLAARAGRRAHAARRPASYPRARHLGGVCAAPRAT